MYTARIHLLLILVLTNFRAFGCKHEETYTQIYLRPIQATYLPREYTTSTSVSVPCEVGVSPVVFDKDRPSYEANTTHVFVDLEMLPKCPDGMTYYNLHCYILTEPQKYPPICPIVNYQRLNDKLFTNVIYSTFYRNTKIWVRAHREDNSQIQWDEPYFNYGTSITTYEKAKPITGKNCVITINEKIYPVNCNEKYPALCVYSYDRHYDNYCKKLQNKKQYSICVRDTLSDPHKCYCTKNLKTPKPRRSEFCEKLAEPILPYQTFLLFTELPSTQTCWFGLYRYSNEIYKWVSSNTLASYSVWAKNIDKTKPYGAINFINNAGWILKNDDGTIHCGICEAQTKVLNITLKIFYNATRNKIQLIVTNPFEIIPFRDTMKHFIFCFTDANNDELHKVFFSGDAISFIFPHSKMYISLLHLQSDHPSRYWCEAYHRITFARIRSNTILAKNKKGKHNQEYVMHAKIFVSSNTDPYLNKLYVQACRRLEEILVKTNISLIIRPIKVINYLEDQNEMNVKMHLSTMEKMPLEEESKLLSSALQNFEDDLVQVRLFTHTKFCLEAITKSRGKLLHWPTARIGTTIVPLELCVDYDGTPVTRKCEGSINDGGIWANVKGDCTEDSTHSNSTLALHDLLYAENVTMNEINQNLSQLTKNDTQTSTLEIHIVSQILEKVAISSENIDIYETTHTVNNVMHYKARPMKTSQILLNSTDNILYNFDQILSKSDMEKDFIFIESSKVLVQISDLWATNITGIALSRIPQRGSFNNSEVTPLYNNVTIESVLDSKCQLATFLPQQLLDEIRRTLFPRTPAKLIIAVYYDDVLFNEQNQSLRSNKSIISVVIPGFDRLKYTQLPLVYKEETETDFNTTCGYWKYGLNEQMESTFGAWSLESNSNQTNSSYKICNFNHTTHYALLMYAHKESVNYRLFGKNTVILKIITYIGCGLSLLGIVAIFVTAALFENWRKQAGNLIMINFSIAIALQMSFLFISDIVPKDSIGCVVVGAILHYSVLSEFCWMLVVGVLQYKKFVSVFRIYPKHLVAKSCIIGWVIPLIPVTILLSISPKVYSNKSFELCYPSKKYFRYGVVLPISLIVAINLMVFLKILLSLCCRKVKPHGPNDDMKLHVLLSILLFFLLGMSWLFGIAVTFADRLIYQYCFCLTATLQGFIMFLFYVVINKKSRLMWTRLQNAFSCLDISAHCASQRSSIASISTNATISTDNQENSKQSS